MREGRERRGEAGEREEEARGSGGEAGGSGGRNEGRGRRKRGEAGEGAGGSGGKRNEAGISEGERGEAGEAGESGKKRKEAERSGKKRGEGRRIGEKRGDRDDIHVRHTHLSAPNTRYWYPVHGPQSYTRTSCSCFGEKLDTPIALARPCTCASCNPCHNAALVAVSLSRPGSWRRTRSAYATASCERSVFTAARAQARKSWEGQICSDAWEAARVDGAK